MSVVELHQALANLAMAYTLAAEEKGADSRLGVISHTLSILCIYSAAVVREHTEET